MKRYRHEKQVKSEQFHKDKRTSKFLSLLLRHKPEKIGITLEKGGWADVETLLNQLSKYGLAISHNDLDRVVEKNNKQRFSYNDDKRKIRANQGHSIDVGMTFEDKMPPPVLYHGTTAERFKQIKMTGGLNKMKRHHVHLSADLETAQEVGRRHGGQTVVLKINTLPMVQNGYRFYLSENGVWLVDEVPNMYIKV
jgi:putative RNA 2'-phosphotransferase